METLFPLEPVLPEGFSYHPGFLSEAEEQELLAAIGREALTPMMFQGYEAKRKTASFGQDWSFERRVLTPGKPFPRAFQPLVERVAGFLGLNASDFGELLLTEYPPGSVINWHRDAPAFALIAGVSLAEDCIFRLRPYEKALQGRKSSRSLKVARRSLYVMQGAARSEWEHSTAPVKATRYSITLRTLFP
ncbi:MAG: alpha-ketoglutarate-dependent dioxygenase AlkB [Chitinophagaceae bacterium]|nr:MAG: alpha-ketoglutarate-dependent dioxygenase AlkB [Chitinophagaceae bacterium]